MRFIGPCAECYSSGHYHSLLLERFCNACRLMKPAAEFYRHKYVTRTGKESTRFMSKCRACHLASKNVPDGLRRETDKRTSVERKRINNANGREKRRRQYERLLLLGKRDVKREMQRRHMKRHYGITPERYFELLDAQGGKCLGCDYIHDDGGVGKRKLHVDHDHKTGKIRGLLCHQCNAAIGFLREDPARLRRLADYIESHLETRNLPVMVGMPASESRGTC